jgi:hypothetical protein
MPAAGACLNACCHSEFKCSFLLGLLNYLIFVFANAVSNTIFMLSEWN